jgi:cell division protein FtsL
MERYSGNNAYRIRLEEREEQRLIRRDNPRYEAYIKARKKEFIGIIMIIMAFALAIVLRYAQISVLNNDVQMMNNMLEDARTVRTNLEIERDRVIDLTHIEDIAVKEYGMYTPKKDQVVYVSVIRNDNITLSKAGFFGNTATR